MLADDAPISHQVNVVVFYRDSRVFKVEAHQHFGTNVSRLHIVLGSKGGFIVV